MPDKRIIGCCRDDSTLFVDFDGKIVTREYPEIRWSDVPIALGNVFCLVFIPAVLSMLAKLKCFCKSLMQYDFCKIYANEIKLNEIYFSLRPALLGGATPKDD